jgi:SAM-dependent methyltransferase
MPDQGSEGLLSPYLRAWRIHAAKTIISGHVLDIGCGTGMLSTLCTPDTYVGYDMDIASVAIAQTKYPGFNFITDLSPIIDESFDTLVALAVIEHIKDPSAWLAQISRYMKPTGSFVLTTPSPRIKYIHNIGSRIGLFSRHANEEHHDLLDITSMTFHVRKAGLVICADFKFMLGFNQMFVLKRIV